MTIEPFLVPCHLLRVGKIKLKEQAAARRSVRSAAVNATTVSPSHVDLKAEIKKQIYERCRCW